MSNDLISREALKAYARKVICGDNPTNSLLIRMFDEIIDNAQTVPLPDFKDCYKQEIDENVQTQSLISRYQHDFVSSSTEVIKVGEPVSNSDEINKALEKGELYKQGFEDAMKRFERPQGEWILQTHERFNSGNELYKYYCNKCGHREEHAYSDSKLPNFCPNCGADMRKGGVANGD